MYITKTKCSVRVYGEEFKFEHKISKETKQVYAHNERAARAKLRLNDTMNWRRVALSAIAAIILLSSCTSYRESIKGCPGNSKYLSGIFKGKFNK